jgi:outer membrane protein W
MKKILFALCLLASQIINAQAYLKLSGGYGFSASKDNFSAPVLVLQANNNSIVSKENVYGTIGSGATIRLAGGYTFSNNFGVELEAYYLMGDKKYVAEESNITNNYNETKFASTKQFRIFPSVYARASKGLIKPYVGFGPVLPLVGFTYLELRTEEPSINKSSYRYYKVSGNPTIGFESYCGASIDWPNENFNLFMEVRYSAVRIKSKKAQLSEWSETEISSGNVTNKLETADLFYTEINFVDKITNESNTLPTVLGGINSSIPDFNKPMDDLTSKNNFNAFGINIGVRVNFVSKKASE